jgi:hypothetical protein
MCLRLRPLVDPDRRGALQAAYGRSCRSETAPASSGERDADDPLGNWACMITEALEFGVEVPPIDKQSGSNPSDDAE